MIDPQIIYIISLAALLILDFFLTAARAALSHATLPRMIAQRDSHELGIPQAIQIISSSPYPRSALHLAHVLARFLLVGLSVGWYYTTYQTLPGPGWMLLILLLAAFLLAWLEWFIEEWVARHPEDWVVRLTTFIRVLVVLFLPFLAISQRLTPPHKVETGPSSVTEDEIKILVDASQQEGVLAQDEREMIYSIFQLGDTLAREIMIPRIDITAIDVQTTIPEAVDRLLQSGFSRLPVYVETVDNIQGLLYTKDLLRYWREGRNDRSLRELLRPAYFVPEAKKVDELLAEMQTQRIHMAMVVDEYGGIAGLVTLEDIVEEIVGEIQDEFDQTEELPYHQVGEGEFIFQGRIDLDDFNEIFGANLPGEEADTLGGFIYNRLGRVPVAQEIVQVDNVILTVEQVLGRRIRKIRARRLPSSNDGVDTIMKDNRDANG